MRKFAKALRNTIRDGIRREPIGAVGNKMIRGTNVTVQKRIEELEHEIAALRAKIARSLKDEEMLFRSRDAVSELDVLYLAEERHRNEAALFNLAEEQSELAKSAPSNISGSCMISQTVGSRRVN